MSNWLELRHATPARIGLGRAGTALPTAAQLDFQLAHARARDAVHAALDTERILAELGALGLAALHLRSEAADRLTYLRRPDLGRRLAAPSRELLLRHPGEGRNPGQTAKLVPASSNGLGQPPPQPSPVATGEGEPRSGWEGAGTNLAVPLESKRVALVIADGLSAMAVNAHAVPLIAAVLPRLAGWRVGPVAVVEGGRVAIGDEIGGIFGADVVAVLIGERPGLSAADSLGVYVTWAPAPGAVDAARNCLSNIRPAGMPIPEAVAALAALMENASRHRVTGVALSQRLALGGDQASI